MIKPMNDFGVHASCLGNHEFDIEMDTLQKHILKCNFPWISTNLFDGTTKKPVCGSQEYHIIEKEGLKIGLIGLIEQDWLGTLPIPDDNFIYLDFLIVAKKWTKRLKEEHKCDLVIALTHMRNPNDFYLAENCPDLDIILGGHDHIRLVEKVNGIYVIKSGTDFREFSAVTLNFPQTNGEEKMSSLPLVHKKFTVEV